jgi:hypothetical protein
MNVGHQEENGLTAELLKSMFMTLERHGLAVTMRRNFAFKLAAKARRCASGTGKLGRRPHHRIVPLRAAYRRVSYQKISKASRHGMAVAKSSGGDTS